MAALAKVARIVNLTAVRRLIGIPGTTGRGAFITSFVGDSLRLTEKRIPPLISRHLSVVAAVEHDRSSSGRDRDQRRPAQTDPVSRQLQVLDLQVQRWGRVDTEEVTNIMAAMEKAGEVSSQQALMVLRCLGALMVKEHPEERQKLFEQLWEKLPQFGVAYNVSHYNAALRVQLENAVKVNAATFLANMESNQIIPNRITYQLLIACYCEDGDIDGASKILEHMKTQNLSINEVVFNMLIKGHMKTGDIEGAKSVMDTMRGSELEPSAETYKTLMCGYAEKGDVDSIQQVLANAETDGVVLHPRHLFEIMFDLVYHGHPEHLAVLLPQIRMTRSYNQDAANCMFRLVTHGHDDAALQVYLTMEKPSSPEQQGHLGRVLLRNMVIKERPLEKVLEFMERLKKEGLSTDTINMLGLWAIKFNKPDYTLQLFRKMKEQDVPVKPHYFWPVFRAFQAQGNKEGVYEALKELSEVVKVETETVVTLYRYATVAMQGLGDDVDTIVAKLQEAGFSAPSVNCVRVMLSLKEGNLTQAATIAACGDTFLSPSLLKAQLAAAYAKSNHDAVSTVELLRLTQEVAGEQLFDLNSSVISEILQTGSLDTQQVEQLLDACIEKGLHVFAGIKAKLTKILETYDESARLIEKLNKIALMGGEERRAMQQVNIPAREFMRKSLAQLEKMLEEAKANNASTKAIEKWLLSKSCASGDVERSMQLKASLDSQGFVYNAELLRQLGYLAARTQEDLGLALKYKQQMETQHPDFSTYVSLVLHIAQLQLKEGAVQDALQTLRDYSEKHGEELKKGGFSENYILADICESLLATCREHCPPEASTEVVKTLFDLGYMKRGTFSMLTHPIKAHIEKEDAAGMLKILEQTVTEFGRAPMFSDIFRALIHKEDADRLQTAVDLVTTVHGEMNVLLHLVFAFIECEKVKQAKKILETPGLRAVMSVLRDGCQRFYNSNKVKEMDQLVDITKDLFAIDRDEMLFQQIRLCAKNGDHKKALDVYVSYEEQNVLPRTRTLRYLAKLLQSHDQEVPFEVPSTAQILEMLGGPADDAQQSQKAGEQMRADSAEEEQAIKLLKAGDIDAFLALKQKSAADSAPFSSDFLAELARIITRDQKTFKMYTYALAEAGEVDSLLVIRQQNLPNTLDHFVHQRIFNAYVKAGRVEELLDYLVENPSLLHKYLTTKGLMKLAETQPHLMAKVELAIEKSNADVTRLDVVTHLFNYYCLTDQMDKADQVVTKYPLLRDQMRVMFLCREAERQNKEDVLKKLVDVMKGSSKRRLSMPYSHLITLKCRDNDWQAALAYFREAESCGVPVEEMWNVALVHLEEQLLNNSQPLPWKAGTLQQRKSLAEDSSSSSDSSSSDSDNEPTK